MNENKPITTDLGAVTAYAAAVEKGYTGTQDDFGQLLANFAGSAQQVADDREAVKEMKNAVDQAANSFDIHVEEKKTEASESISAAANTAKEESIAAIQEASTSGVKSVQDKTSEGVKALEMSSQTGVSNITAAVEEGKKNFVTDNTLAIPGRAADAKVTGDKIGELKEDLVNFSGFHRLTFVDGYIDFDTNNVNVNDPQISYKGVKYCVIDCVENDVFVISGKANNSTTAPLYGFINDKGIRIEVSEPNTVLNNEIVTTPSGATKLVIHNRDNSVCYKGDTFSYAMKEKVDNIDFLHIEQGAIDTSGNLIDSESTVRTCDYVSTGIGVVKVKDGYVVRYAHYYDSSKSRTKYVLVNRQVYTIDTEYPFVKLSFKKNDGSAFSVIDFKNNCTIEKIYVDAKELSDKKSLMLVLFEQGSINLATGVLQDSTKRIRNNGYIKANGQVFSLPDGFMFRSISLYDSDGAHISTTLLNTKNVSLPQNENLIKLQICKSDPDATITPAEFKEIDTVEYLNKKIEDVRNQYNNAPLIKFEISKNLINVTSDVLDWNCAEKDANDNYLSLEKVYDLYDSLMQNHPDCITREDIAETLGISYPAYASGYNNVPAYKTYLYKYHTSNKSLGNESFNKKKSVLIVCGTHGNEIASCFNSYLFFKRLCEINEESDYYKFGQAFDVYIIPCLNGYGIYKGTRYNGNGVNINRNYPTSQWSMSGSAYEMNYSGEYGGSEFETQLVMGATKLYNPDMAFDHHSYFANEKCQFYTQVTKEKFVGLTYQSACDISYALKKSYPQYFGSDVSILRDTNKEELGVCTAPGATTQWWAENVVRYGATIEVSSCINYVNGVHANYPTDEYGPDTFSINEYTLRNQLLRGGQWILDNN